MCIEKEQKPVLLSVFAKRLTLIYVLQLAEVGHTIFKNILHIYVY